MQSAAPPLPLSNPLLRLQWRPLRNHTTASSFSHPDSYLPRRRPVRATAFPAELRSVRNASVLRSPAMSPLLMGRFGYPMRSNPDLGRGLACLSMGELNADRDEFEEMDRMCPDDPDATKECDEVERQSASNSIERRTSLSMLVGVATTFVLATIWMATNMMSGRSLAYLVAKASKPFFSSHQTSPHAVPQYSIAQIQEETISLDFIKKMIEDFKNQKPLDKRVAYEIIKKTREVLRPLPSLVDITVPDGKHITVCGDVHGQFYDLVNIFELNGLPSEDNPYIFNGDFVDRGAYSVEVILTLFAFKCMCPSGIYLTRGNHESKEMNELYGFEAEVVYKLGAQFVQLFAEVFCCLPLAHLVNEKIFVVHGGIPNQDGVKLSDIRAIDRLCEPPERGLMCELLWNDPRPFPGWYHNIRGVGYTFGEDATKKFLQDNDLELIVRSHEVKNEGYEFEHDGKLVTVFSAPNYCGRLGNKGAFIRFVAPEMKPGVVTFHAVNSMNWPKDDGAYETLL